MSGSSVIDFKEAETLGITFSIQKEAGPQSILVMTLSEPTVFQKNKALASADTQPMPDTCAGPATARVVRNRVGITRIAFRVPSQKTLRVLAVAGHADASEREIPEDVKLVTEALKSKAGDLYDKTVVRTLTAEEATPEALRKALEMLADQARPQDTFFYYQAGTLKASFPALAMKQQLDQLGIRRRVFIFDTDYASDQFRSLSQGLLEKEDSDAELMGRSTVLVAPTGKGQAVALRSGAKPGALAYAIITGLEGEAKLANYLDGRVTAEELASFLPRKVKELSAGMRVSNIQQGADFPLTQVALAMDTRGLKSSVTITKKEPEFVLGKNYALLAGTDTYSSPAWPKLSNPIFDVTEVGRLLQGVYGYLPGDVTTLQNPSQRDLKKQLAAYAKLTPGPNDQLLIFIAGHGYFDESAKMGYLVPPDAQSPKDDETRESYYPYSDLRDRLDALPFKHIFLVLDACYGGTFDRNIALGSQRAEDDKGGYPLRSRPDLLRLKLEPKTRLFISSGGKTYVRDGRPGAHSPFAHQLIATLRGFDQNKNGVLTWYQLREQLQKVAKPDPIPGQFGSNESGSDFLFLVKGK